MARAARDVNSIPTLIGVSSADGATPILLEVDPDTGEVLARKFEFAVVVAVDSIDSNIQYVGKAIPGTLTSVNSWRIMRVNSTSGTVVTWADGNTLFDNIFDNRESLSYS